MYSMKETIKKILNGSHADLIPLAPRWDLFYDAMVKNNRLPEQYRNMSYFELTTALGMGIKAPRCRVFTQEIVNIAIQSKIIGNKTFTEYDTPYGMVSTVFQRTSELEAEGVRGLQTEFIIKDEKDFDAAKYIIENTKIIPVFEEFTKIESVIGERGVAFAQAGYCPFHDIMRNYMGYEKTYLAMYDHPNQMESLLEILNEKAQKATEVLLMSPAEIITIDGHFNGQMTPPPIYEKYFLPYFKAFSDKLHKAGKLMASHTDGDMDGLLELFLLSGFDIAEAFTPPPMGRISVKQAREVWKDKVTIWGGVASVMFSSLTSESDFEEHVQDLFDSIAPGDKIIIGTGDNIPTDALLSRVIRLKEIVGLRGRYPVTLRK